MPCAISTRLAPRARPGLLLLLGNETGFRSLYLLSPQCFDPSFLAPVKSPHRRTVAPTKVETMASTKISLAKRRIAITTAGTPKGAASAAECQSVTVEQDITITMSRDQPWDESKPVIGLIRGRHWYNGGAAIVGNFSSDSGPLLARKLRLPSIPVPLVAGALSISSIAPSAWARISSSMAWINRLQRCRIGVGRTRYSFDDMH